jgi:hypothetical protein
VVIKWVAGLMGPIAIPFMLGLLKSFRKSGPTAALVSWAAGLLAFYLVNYPIDSHLKDGVALEYQVSVPLAVSLVLFIVIGYLKPEDTPARDVLLARINGEGDGDGSGITAASLNLPGQAEPSDAKVLGSEPRDR